ncbi:MAG: type II toxin-antitoxin system HipA family toxin [Gammaproteobacteria bacterium]|nr:type II toxin-antitoxin system HipA family toxin [Gammaproteobacteria bacterium]
MSYSPVMEVKVGLNFGVDILPVGRLAIRNGQIYFEYHLSFIERDLEISPLRLSLQPGVRTFERFLFEGLPGVFNDSLPDGWGRLLLDRTLRMQEILPEQLSSLDRLLYVGNTGMGALVYEPDYNTGGSHAKIDLDVLASHAQAILKGDAGEVLQELLALNGSSAGARPKAMIGVDSARQHIIHGFKYLHESYESWLVKFPNMQDGSDAGAIEYIYAQMAREAGIALTPSHLFPAQHGAGYFATQRFDREGSRRLHCHTACGLLHSDFRTPSLDYEDLIALSEILTRDVREVEKMFQLAVFNVLAHNRDDHAKNFTFLMDEKGEWKLAPAYDLTFSSGPRGEQSTMVMGEGKNPGKAHLIKLGQVAKLKLQRITQIIEQTQHALSAWERLAKEFGVSKTNIELIAKRLSVTA